MFHGGFRCHKEREQLALKGISSRDQPAQLRYPNGKCSKHKRAVLLAIGGPCKFLLHVESGPHRKTKCGDSVYLFFLIYRENRSGRKVQRFFSASKIPGNWLPILEAERVRHTGSQPLPARRQKEDGYHLP